MIMFKKILLASALIAPGALAAVSAQAQSTVAVADPDAAIANSKVWATAQTQIATTYKPQLDAAKARGEAIAAELQPLYLKLDTNGDKQLSQQEIEAARAARRPEFTQIEAKEKAGQEEIGRMTAQAGRARAYAIEQLSARVNEAVTNVVKARKITLLVRPQAVFFADPAASDITSAISAEIDRLLPTVSITPPANWQPGQQPTQPGVTPAPTTTPRAAERPR